ncbi:MAG: permease, partial [Micrococcales bacterium]|nr:permease [Micrococcales bacterium]
MLISAAALWLGAYLSNERVWTWAFDAAGLDVADRLAGAAHFFIYDTIKVLLPLIGMIFLIGLLRTVIR